MMLLIILLVFLSGFALGKQKPNHSNQKHFVKKIGDVRGVGGFLTYDGTEQL